MSTLVSNLVRRPGPYGRGRRCRERGCRTILCSYNPSHRCWVHDGWVEAASSREQRESFGELIGAV